MRGPNCSETQIAAVTISSRDLIFANHDFAISAFREDIVTAKKWDFTVLRALSGALMSIDKVLYMVKYLPVGA